MASTALKVEGLGDAGADQGSEWRTVNGIRIMVPVDATTREAIIIMQQRMAQGANVATGSFGSPTIPRGTNTSIGDLLEEELATIVPRNLTPIPGMNEDLVRQATSIFVNEATQILIRDLDAPNPADRPSSFEFAGIVMDLEQRLVGAGVRNDGIAAQIESILSLNHLRDLAEQQGLTISDIKARSFDSPIIRNRATRILWDQAGILTIGGIKADDVLEEYQRQLEEQLRRSRVGGAVGPKYVRPDDDLVRDWVRGRLRITVGDVAEERVDWLTDVFFATDRKNFDNPEQEFDPRQAVKENIRRQADYIEIHANRAEDIDEDGWLPQFVASQAQQGLDPSVALIRGKDLATIGATGSADLFQAQRLGRSDSFIERASAVNSVIGSVLR